MSYEIVKGFKVDSKKKEVWLKSSSSNEFPKNYNLWEAKTLSKIFKEKGREELDKEILREFYIGNFQKSSTNYEKSLALLDRKKYNWNTVSDSWEHIQKPKESFSYDELKEVLYENYQSYNNRKKGSFIIINTELKMFVAKIGKGGCRLALKEQGAKVFTSREEAMYKSRKFDASKYKVEESKVASL